MTRRKLPKSIRKYIRLEKARLRRAITDLREREQKIRELLKQFGVSP
ncbi:MAG: hypothetical protein WC659_05110 [Patescibacteria group bacterium]